MLKRYRTIVLVFALIPALSAANSAADFDLRYLLAVLGLGSVGVMTAYARQRDRSLLRFESRVDSALWGPEDPKGDRDSGEGLVPEFRRLVKELPALISTAREASRHAKDAAVAAQAAARHAEAAASAAKAAQMLLLERSDSDRADFHDRRHP